MLESHKMQKAGTTRSVAGFPELSSPMTDHANNPAPATAKGMMLMVPFFILECSLGSYAHEVHTGSPTVNLMISCFNYQLLPGGFLRLQIQYIASIGK